MPQKTPNILILMTDQQRQVQHFPEGFAERYLPNLSALMRDGVSFPNALTNACRCSPVRGMLWTSLYPPRTGLTAINGTMKLDPTLPTLGYLLTHGAAAPLPPVAGQQAPPDDPADLYYHVVYNGKWHCYAPFATTAQNPDWPSAEIAHDEYQDMFDIWGLPGWQSPDAGTSINNDSTIGGGPFTARSASNDPQYQYAGPNAIRPDYGPPYVPRRWNDKRYADNALAFLEGYDADRPFLAVASLVNPHDIWLWDQAVLPEVFPEAAYYLFGQGAEPELPPPPPGYYVVDGEQQTTATFMTDFAQAFASSPEVQAWLQNGNFHDDLSRKPAVHTQVQTTYNPHPSSQAEALQYLTFYGYLTYLSDVLHGQICATLAATADADGAPLSENTLVVRIADHGETGCSHAGMMEKDINVYQETIRVPIVFSHPGRWKGLAASAPAPMGTVDITPTLLEMAGLDLSAPPFRDGDGRSIFQGESFAAYIEAQAAPAPAPAAPRRASLFTYDDGYGSDTYHWRVRGVVAAPGSHAVSGGTVTLDTWVKYAVYYTYLDPSGQGGAGTQPIVTFGAGTRSPLHVQYELYEDYLASDETDNLLAAEPAAWSPLHADMHALLTHLLHQADAQGPTPLPPGRAVTPGGWDVIRSHVVA